MIYRLTTELTRGLSCFPHSQDTLPVLQGQGSLFQTAISYCRILIFDLLHTIILNKIDTHPKNRLKLLIYILLYLL